MTLSSGYDGPELMMEELTIHDLSALDLLAPDVWDNYLAEKRCAKEAQAELHGAHLLASAIESLGIDRVKEMVGKTAPEN